MADLAAGWRYVGKAEKPDDRRTVPLCPRCHMNGRESQHTVGEETFWRRIGIRPSELCTDLSTAFDRGAAMLPVIARWASTGRKNREAAR
jgi:hypothetical protein